MARKIHFIYKEGRNRVYACGIPGYFPLASVRIEEVTCKKCIKYIKNSESFVSKKIHLDHNMSYSKCGIHKSSCIPIVQDVSLVTCLNCLKLAGENNISGLGKTFELCGSGANKRLKIILKPLPPEDIQVAIDFVLEKMEAWIEPPPKER